VGFTTSESEKVVNHPVRRRILLLLMILGNAGIVTGVASLIIGFSGIEGGLNTWLKLAILLAGILGLWYLANSQWVDQQLSGIINRILKQYTRVDVNDYASLLQLSGEFRISEQNVECKHWLCKKKLKNTKLRDEGLNILAISRNDGTFIGNPNGETIIRENDSLIIYGRATALNKLEKRLKGDRGNREHKQMMRQQEKILKKEKKMEEKV
jgi:hypothetical protein